MPAFAKLEYLKVQQGKVEGAREECASLCGADGAEGYAGKCGFNDLDERGTIILSSFGMLLESLD